MRYLIPAFAALALLGSTVGASAQTSAPTAKQNDVAPRAAPQVAPKLSRLAKRFAAANTTHDGQLTLVQAKTAKWTQVVKRFSKIDVGNKGYVTEAEITAAGAKPRAAKPATANKS